MQQLIETLNRSVVLFYKKDEVKLEGKVVPLHTMEAQWEVEVWLCSFLIMAIDGAEWSALCPSHCMPRERTHSTHPLGGKFLSLTWLISTFVCYMLG